MRAWRDWHDWTVLASAAGTAALFLGPSLAAQAPAQMPPAAPTLHIGVTAVEIDAVVTDRDGKHVSDLQASDFELLQDGKPQPITSFRYVPVRRRQDADRAQAPVLPPGSTAAPQLLRGQAGRIMAVVIDDLSLEAADMTRVRAALASFVDHDLRPDDAVAIVKTSGGVGRLQQFTNDRSKLQETISRLQITFQGIGIAGEEIDALNADEMDQSAVATHRAAAEHQKASADFIDELLRSGSLNAVQNVVRGMRDLPGRKSVLFVNDGFALISQNDRFMQRRPYLMEAFSRLVDEANRSFVVIHTLDARGLTNPLTAVFNAERRAAPSNAPDFSTLSKAQRESQEGPLLLAHLGGGLAFSGNDFGEAFKRALADQEGYYLLGYQPDSATFRRASDTPMQFHGVRVRVKRDGLRTRARSGFFGITDEEAHPAPRTAEDRLWTVASSPFIANDLGVRVTPLFAHTPGSDALHVLVHVDGQGLSFTKGADGQYRAPIELLSALVDDRGAVVESTLYTFTLGSPGEPTAARRDAGFTCGIDVPARQPGAYQLRIAARDVTSNRSGNGYQFVRVPNLAKARLALSGVLLQTAGAGATLPAGSEPGTGPAVRRFRAASTLAYAFETYNAQVDPVSHAPALTLRLRLYRDGSLVLDGKPTPIEARPKPDDPPRTATVARELQLSQNLRPGDYQLQLEVTDTRVRKSTGTAHQWIDFTIMGTP